MMLPDPGYSAPFFVADFLSIAFPLVASMYGATCFFWLFREVLGWVMHIGR